MSFNASLPGCNTAINIFYLILPSLAAIQRWIVPMPWTILQWFKCFHYQQRDSIPSVIQEYTRRNNLLIHYVYQPTSLLRFYLKFSRWISVYKIIHIRADPKGILTPPSFFVWKSVMANCELSTEIKGNAKSQKLSRSNIRELAHSERNKVVNLHHRGALVICSSWPQ